MVLMLTSFTPDVEYPRGDVDQNGNVNIDDVTTLINYLMRGIWPDEPVIPEDNHEYVDLGLPSGTLWATCNIGAETPEEYGDYFAWGETQPKEVYDWSTYKWCNGSMYSLTKYNTNTRLGIVDGKTELDPEDDAAYVNWGPWWRTPTAEQQHELYDKCEWIRTRSNGVKGYRIKGPNGNSIFLPAAGYRSDASIVGTESLGSFWSSSCYTSNGISTNAFSASDVGFDWGDWSYYMNGVYHYRYYGHSVRAVRVPPVDDRSLYFEQKSLTLGEAPIDETITGELTIVNKTVGDKILTATADAPFKLIQEDGTSSTSTYFIVPGESSITVTVAFTATEPGQFNGNVTFKHQALDEGQSVIPVNARAYVYGQPQYVDLGLPSGTLWATMNVGACKPEDSGDYFAWGETEPKDVYDWSNYKWCNGSNITLTKYCTNSHYGKWDNKKELDPEDDVARVKWGPMWCMPTQAQMSELMNRCTWTWTTINDVPGYLVTGSNGNSVFLPAAGIRDGSELSNYGMNGLYWTRTLDSMEGSDRASGLSFHQSSSPAWSYTYSLRYFGQTIRPVYVAPTE